MLGQQELKESAITKLTSVELKSDYHNLILLAFLQDLAKCIYALIKGATTTMANWHTIQLRLRPSSPKPSIC
jgi:hypothetical protein